MSAPRSLLLSLVLKPGLAQKPATLRPLLALVTLGGSFGAVVGGATSGFSGSSALPLPPNFGGRLSALLPTTNQNAQEIRNTSKLTIVTLQQKVVSVGGSREALQNIMASAAHGEIPAYDSRLGISREDFRKYLAFQPVLEPTGKTIRLSVVRDASRVTFTDLPSNGVLRGLSFDLKTGELRVPEGFGFKPSYIGPNNAPDRTVDIRSGFQWNLRGYSAETQSGVRGQVSLYQLGDGQTVLSYRRTSSLIHGTFNNSENEIIIKYAR